MKRILVTIIIFFTDIIIAHGQIIGCHLLCNSDFENVQVVSPGNWVGVDQSNIPCWKTTASDRVIEVWGSGFLGVPAYSGSQFVELNANMVSTLYQDFTVIPGSSVSISFAHRGRQGVDVMSVSIGPVNGPFITLGTFSSDNTGWHYYTVPYTFPNNGITTYSLRFNSISAAGGDQAIGNLLDDISVDLPHPDISLIKTDISCNSLNGGSITAIVSAGSPPYLYNWQSVQSSSNSLTNLVAGNYSLTVSDSYGCQSTDSVTIYGQVAHILQNDTTICSGNPVHLSVALPPASGNTILPPWSRYEYTFNTPPVGWTTSTGGWTLGNAPFGNYIDTDHSFSPDFNYNTYWPANIPDHPDGYDLYVRRNIDLTGYDLSDIHWHVGIDNGYLLYINGHRVDSSNDINGGYAIRWEYEAVFPAAFLLPGNNVIAVALEDYGGLTAFDMMIDGRPYHSTSSVVWSTGDTTAGITVTPTQTTIYYVTVTNGTTSCMDSVRVTVKQPSSQLVNATICQGNNFSGYTASGVYIDHFVNVNGCDSIRTLNLTVKPRSYFSIDKSICQGENYAGHSQSGVYIDTLIASNGCDSVRTIHLNVLQKKTPWLGADTILCSGDSIILYPGPFNTYRWQNGSTQSHFTATQPGIYSVFVTDACDSTQSRILIKGQICDIYFPSAFTPNNDGRNDLFKILNGYHLQDYHLAVYNRWGQIVFETNDSSTGWDGRFKGQMQDNAVFVWYCEFRKTGNANKKVMQGTVTLIR